MERHQQGEGRLDNAKMRQLRQHFEVSRVNEGFLLWLQIIRSAAVIAIFDNSMSVLGKGESLWLMLPTALVCVACIGVATLMVRHHDQLDHLMVDLVGSWVIATKVGLQILFQVLFMLGRTKEHAEAIESMPTRSFQLSDQLVFLGPSFGFGVMHACVSFMPDRYYFGLCLPLWLSGWMHYFVSIKASGLANIAVSGAAFPMFCALCRHEISKVHWDKFVATHQLIEARADLDVASKHLWQQVDAQQSMWASVFDATCLLDSTGRVINASPHVCDVLQVLPETSLDGQPLSGLSASHTEGRRLNAKLRSVLDSPSNQALIWQSSFLTGEGAALELLVNAVRLAYQSNAQDMTSYGILCGLRHVAHTKSSELSDPTTNADFKSFSEAPDQLMRYRNLWVKFDAGTRNFVIQDASPELLPGWLEWLPFAYRAKVERWAVDEVAACHLAVASREQHTPKVAKFFELRLPTARVWAQAAWIQVDAPDDESEDDEAACATLMLRGVTMRHRSGVVPDSANVEQGRGDEREAGGPPVGELIAENLPRPAHQAEGVVRADQHLDAEVPRASLDMPPIGERRVERAGLPADVPRGGVPLMTTEEADDASTVLAPDDSASQAGDRFIIPLQ